MLFAVFVKGKREHDLLPGLKVEGDQDLTGFVTMSQLHDILLLCWLLMCHTRLENVKDDKVSSLFFTYFRISFSKCVYYYFELSFLDFMKLYRNLVM